MNDIKEKLIFIDLFTKELIVVEKVKKSLYTPSQKKAIYKYRENNRAEYNEKMKPYKAKYYESHKDAINEKKREQYFLEKEMKRFRNILF